MSDHVAVTGELYARNGADPFMTRTNAAIRKATELGITLSKRVGAEFASEVVSIAETVVLSYGQAHHGAPFYSIEPVTLVPCCRSVLRCRGRLAERSI